MPRLSALLLPRLRRKHSFVTSFPLPPCQVAVKIEKNQGDRVVLASELKARFETTLSLRGQLQLCC